MKNPSPTEIGQKIIEVSGVNIYDNSRKRDNVEYRGLICYLLRTKLHLRWKSIALFMNRNGKRFDHASAIHSVNMYPLYKKYNVNLKKIENLFLFTGDLNYDEIDEMHYITNKYNNIKEKYNDLLKNPLLNSIHDIPEEKQKEVADQITLIKKSWEWK